MDNIQTYYWNIQSSILYNETNKSHLTINTAFRSWSTQHTQLSPTPKCCSKSDLPKLGPGGSTHYFSVTSKFESVASKLSKLKNPLWPLRLVFAA